MLPLFYCLFSYPVDRGKGGFYNNSDLKWKEGYRVYTTSDFRNGLKVELEGTPYEIVEFLHVKPGKGGAFIRTKLRNLETGAVTDHTFRAGERVKKPNLKERVAQYIYQDGDNYFFMDTETYEELALNKEHLGEAKKFLQENLELTILYHNDRPLGVELPIFVEVKVSKTAPGIRGDTASGGTKPAEIESGAAVQVPLFIDEGDIIKVDTRTGEYVERVSAK
jgi:elongation factor P